MRVVCLKPADSGRYTSAADQKLRTVGQSRSTVWGEEYSEGVIDRIDALRQGRDDGCGVLWEAHDVAEESTLPRLWRTTGRQRNQAAMRVTASNEKKLSRSEVCQGRRKANVKVVIGSHRDRFVSADLRCSTHPPSAQIGTAASG